MRKKSTMIIISLLSSFLVLGACGTKNKVTPPPPAETNTTTTVPNETTTAPSETTTAPSKNNTATKDHGMLYGFTSFKLDADSTDAVKVDYDEERTDIDAKYENKKEKINLHGKEAVEKLDPIFKKLLLTYDMADEEVIKKVSDAFGIHDSKSFDLKIKFTDHDIKEYKVKK